MTFSFAMRPVITVEADCQFAKPSGANIHEKGIEPDVKVEMTRDEVKEALKDPSKDKQLKKALELLK